MENKAPLSWETEPKEDKISKEKWQRWETASSPRRIFMFHPEAPWLVRAVAFVWLILAVLGLLFFTVVMLMAIIGVERDIQKGLPAYIFIAVMSLAELFISYGLSHLKRWSLYLFGATLIFIFLLGREILFGPAGLIGLIAALYHHKKFS